MADTKITALAAITTVDPAADVLPIVDISDTSMAASGTTKKITSNQILGAGGTATLASATITGDLTVDTSTLKVDSANNRVGIGTATPSTALNVVAGSSGINTTFDTPSAGDTRIELKNNGTRAGYLYWDTSEVRQFADSGRALTFYPNGTLGMTLNSTGLGVGASPSTRLHISNTGDVYARIATTSVSKAGVQLSANGVVRSHLLYDDGAGTTYLTTGTSFGGSGQALVIQSGTSLGFYTNNQLATANMTLDASGNLILLSSNTPATLTTNGQLTVNATSNTNLRFSYRGSDGVTRVANLTLA